MTGDSGTLSQTYDRPFRLMGDWEVALTHLKLTERPMPVFVFCDLVEYAHVNDKRMRFLDYWASKNHRIASPYYVKVVKKRFACINVNIGLQPDEEDLPSGTDITCILHFRKI